MDKIIEDVCSQYERDQYAMYLRKSRADIELEALGEGETLAKHKKALYALAAKHDIHPDQITVYQEIVSGESLDDRPEAQRLLTDVYKKKYKGVLVMEIERLARGNTKDQGEVADAFQNSNTHILTPAKFYDPESETDQEYFEFGLFMSRREYKTIRRRLVAGKEQSALDGNYLLPQRILGYDIVKPSKKERYLVVNKEEEKLVHMIFDWFTEDHQSTGWIARQLTTMGIPTLRKNKEWSKETIKDMLRNPIFIGKIRWGRFKTIKRPNPDTGKLEKVRVRNAPADVKIVEGKHEGIISEEQFEKAQSLLTKKQQSHVNVNLEIVNPLAGLLFCAKCGKSMAWFNAKHGRVIRYHHRESAICKVKSLPVDVVLDALVESLKAAISDFEMKMETDYSKEEQATHLEMIAVMESELEKTERKRRKLFDDYEDEVYTKEEFIERKLVYAKKIESLKENIKVAKEATPEPINYEERILRLHEAIDYIKSPDYSAKEKNLFLKQVIDTIKYDAIDYGRNKGGKPVLDVYIK